MSDNTHYNKYFFDTAAYNGQNYADAGARLELFEEMFKELVELLIIVEALGMITREVNLLPENYGFSGTKVLQFAFKIKIKHIQIITMKT